MHLYSAANSSNTDKATLSFDQAFKLLTIEKPKDFNGICHSTLKEQITFAYKKQLATIKNNESIKKQLLEAKEILCNPEQFKNIPLTFLQDPWNNIKKDDYKALYEYIINNITSKTRWNIEELPYILNVFPDLLNETIKLSLVSALNPYGYKQEAYETGSLIHWAIKNKNQTLLKICLEADPNRQNVAMIPAQLINYYYNGIYTGSQWQFDHYAPLAYAIETNNKEAFDLLLEYTAHLKRPWFSQIPLKVARKTNKDPYFKNKLLILGHTRSSITITKHITGVALMLLSYMLATEDHDYTKALLASDTCSLTQYLMHCIQNPTAHKRLLSIPATMFFYWAT
jgi:hypothetical protein